MKTFFKRISIIMVITFILPSILGMFPALPDLSAKEALAAEAEAILDTNELKTGIECSPAYVFIDHHNDGALYKYTSADTNIATVDENGYVSGVSLGKTTISVIESVDGLEKNLGSVPVSIHDAEFADKAFHTGLNSDNYLNINYLNNSAEYKYKSADTDIATVSNYGNVTGIKYGSTTITLTETYKGKTKMIGTIPVHVVKAKLDGKVQTVSISKSANTLVNISYMNSEATYKYSCSDTKIVKVDKTGHLTGLKEGTAKINVTEVYQNKTRKLGNVTVKVEAALISSDESRITIPIHSSNYFNDIVEIDNNNWDAQYTCKSADSKIVYTGYEKNFYGEKNFMIKGLSLGETTLTVYEEYKGITKVIGTIHVTVKEFPVIKLAFIPDYVDNINGVFTKTFYLGTDYSLTPVRNLLTMQPYNTTTPITYSSSDEKVIKIDDYGYVIPVSEGTATITITCGKFTAQMKAIVLPASASESSH